MNTIGSNERKTEFNNIKKDKPSLIVMAIAAVFLIAFIIGASAQPSEGCNGIDKSSLYCAMHGRFFNIGDIIGTIMIVGGLIYVSGAIKLIFGDFPVKPGYNVAAFVVMVLGIIAIWA